jgi:hypothetical protein
MPTLTPEALAKARATRAQKQADTPLYRLAKVLKLKPQTLYAKFAYHEQRIKGATLGALVKTLETKTRTKLTEPQRRQLGMNGNGAAPPPILSNPSAEAPGNGRVKNLRLALIALTGVEKLILPLRPGHYGQRELLELEALDYLRRIDKDG